MKTWFLAAATATLTALLPTVTQASDVGVSIHFNQPGVFGRVDFGRHPQPYPQPRYVAPPPVVMQPLRVLAPFEHQRHWNRYCHLYNACGVPVVFVQPEPHRRYVVPAYSHRHDGHRDVPVAPRGYGAYGPRGWYGG
jgi:hypothetical protein